MARLIGSHGVAEVRRGFPGAVEQRGAAQGPVVLARYVPRRGRAGDRPTEVHGEAVAGDGTFLRATFAAFRPLS